MAGPRHPVAWVHHSNPLHTCVCACLCANLFVRAWVLVLVRVRTCMYVGACVHTDAHVHVRVSRTPALSFFLNPGLLTEMHVREAERGMGAGRRGHQEVVVLIGNQFTRESMVNDLTERHVIVVEVAGGTAHALCSSKLAEEKLAAAPESSRSFVWLQTEAESREMEHGDSLAVLLALSL